MTNNREILAYALKAQQLHQILVLKDDIHLQYKYKNINRASNQAATFQDKIIDAVIEDAVTGTSDPITKSTVTNAVEDIIDVNLRNDAKRISYGIPDKAVEAAVSNISNRYQWILGNRIREEIPTLQGKIDDYIAKNDLRNLSEAELMSKLKAEYGEHAQKRIQNIIKDSFHTNECNLSWIKAVNDGYLYKSWNNGRTKRTRSWHKAKFIQSVPIDETFDIFGSYPARMMYPGDLNGGAENVANCKCWLSYSNRPPSDLRGTGKKTTTWKRKSNNSKQSSTSGKNNNGVFGKIKDTVKKPINKIREKIQSSNDSNLMKLIKPKDIIQRKNSTFELTTFPTKKENKTYGRIIKNKFKKTKHFLYRKKYGENIQIIEFNDVIIIKQEGADYIKLNEVIFAYNRLPISMKSSINKIVIKKDYYSPNMGDVIGSVHPLNRKLISLYDVNMQIDKKEYFKTIYHEASHTFELKNIFNKFSISNSPVWEKAIIDDEQHIINNNLYSEFGCFSTEYAEDMYYAYKDKDPKRKYSEDFAESVMMYLDKDEEFRLLFPNKCRVIEEVLGVVVPI